MDRGGQSGSHYFVLPRGSGRRVGVGAGVRKGKKELVSHTNSFCRGSGRQGGVWGQGWAKAKTN